MAGSAAHLVDCVLPNAPIRQFVLAYPYELSGLAATRPEVLSALSRIFWEAIRRRYRSWATSLGLSGPAETGAVTGVHRAGASLNVHTHFHVLRIDGVYVEQDEALRFVAAPAPTRAELETMLQGIYARVMKWLSKRGLLRDPHASNEAPSLTSTEALTMTAMQRGVVVTTREAGDESEVEYAAAPPRETDAVVYERFNLHASVRIAVDNDLGRERLCRYLSRPAFVLTRLRMVRDGRGA